jgi:plasmid replication initiation protein
MSIVKTDVIKHSAAIQISNDVSLLQRRAWNVLLAYAFDGLMDKEEHYINLKDLYSQLEYNSNDINHIKELLKNIVSINVEWNILRKDGKQEWGVVSLLSEVEICDGVLKYSFAPGLRKKLYNPSMYAKLNLSLQNKFTSKYSLGLYEIFIDYFDLQRGQGETPWIDIGEFRKLMGLKENEYSRYTDLNHYIIKKSIKEINE